MRWHMRHMGSIGEARTTFPGKTGDPLIACLLADPKSDTQFGDRMPALMDEANEFFTLQHGSDSPPRHDNLQRVRAQR
jgi:hypothetical protein